jgi:hypothetical protein
MSPSRFDSYPAFREAIESLEAFNRLIRDRRFAISNCPGVSLKEWVVLGRFYFDSRGKVLKFNPGCIPAVIFPNFPSVLSREDYYRFLKRYLGPGEVAPRANLTAHLPQLGWRCPECSHKWTVKTCHDVICDANILRHHRCYRLFQIKTERAYFEKVFAEAGFAQTEFSAIRNPYCTQEFCPPWFEVVSDGVRFTIGNWRNRLIIIICKDKRVDFEAICPDCDVTKGTDFIHAWGREMAIIYLVLVKKAFSPS